MKNSLVAPNFENHALHQGFGTSLHIHTLIHTVRTLRNTYKKSENGEQRKIASPTMSHIAYFRPFPPHIKSTRYKETEIELVKWLSLGNWWNHIFAQQYSWIQFIGSGIFIPIHRHSTFLPLHSSVCTFCSAQFSHGFTQTQCLAPFAYGASVLFKL